MALNAISLVSAIDLLVHLVASIARAFLERAGSADLLMTTSCSRPRSRHRLLCSLLLLLLVFRTACRDFRGFTRSTVRRAAAAEFVPEASAVFLCERVVLCRDWLHLASRADNLLDLRFGVDSGLRSYRRRQTSSTAATYDCRRELLSSSCVDGVGSSWLTERRRIRRRSGVRWGPAPARYRLLRRQS